MLSTSTEKATDSGTHVLISQSGTKYTRRKRKPLSAEQKKELENAFKNGVVGSNTLLKYSREAQDQKKAALEQLARKTDLSLHQVRQWFTNRRKKQRLHAERVTSSLSGATPFIRRGKRGKKKMDEESRQRASGLKVKPKRTKPLSTDCASISFMDLLGSDFSEDLVASFNVIQNFFNGKLPVTRDPNDQRCKKWIKSKRENRYKIVNFCIMISEHYFGKQISDAVVTIANEGQIPALVNFIVGQSTDTNEEKHFRFMIVYSAIAVYGGDRVITSLCASMSKGFGKATTFDMEKILEMLPELRDKGYRKDFLKSFSCRARRKPAQTKRTMDRSPGRLDLKKQKVSSSDSKSGSSLEDRVCSKERIVEV